MKIERSKSKSGLFLMELIIAIVFFSIASAVCIQLFVQAHLVNRRSADISAAVSLAQNYAEEFKALPYETQLGRTEQYFGYDESGQMIRLQDGNGASYLLKAEVRQEEPRLEVAEISVIAWNGPTSLLKGEVLCSFDARRANLTY